MIPLAPLLLDPDIEALAAWLADTPPPPGPLVLGTDRQGRPWLTVDDPASLWAAARLALADGLRGQHGRGWLLMIRRVKEVMPR